MLFAGNETHHGTHGAPELDPIGGVKWAIGRTAKQMRGPATLELWEKHLEGKMPLGVVPVTNEAKCVWGSIDIDDYDVDTLDVIKKVEAARLPLLPGRSKSGGLHLFMFTTEPVDAALMQSTLRDIAASIGHAGCEIFPKQTRLLVEQGDQGNWMVMPYFGSTYGGKLKEQVGLKKTGAEMTMAEFLSAAEKMRVSPDKLTLVRVKKPKKERPPFSDGPPCLVHLTQNGGVPQGGQNNVLFHMGVYFKRAFPEDWKKRLEDANQKFCNPPYPSDKLAVTIKSLDKKDYQYKCKDEPMASHCDAMQCRARKFGVGAGGTYPQITGLSKLNTEPPIWFIDVEGARISASTEELQTYNRFHRLCMENTHKSFAIISQNVWFGVLNEAMQSLTLIPASEDIGVAGHFLELLTSFLTDRARGKQKEDLITGRPWEDEEHGRHYFQLTSLQKFLEREGLKSLSLHRGQITTRIEKMGGGHQGMNIKGRFRNFWWVPIEVIGVSETTDTPKDEENEL